MSRTRWTTAAVALWIIAGVWLATPITSPGTHRTLLALAICTSVIATIELHGIRTREIVRLTWAAAAASTAAQRERT